MLSTPADGSTTTDTTPTFTGTAVPGSTVDISVDGNVIATNVPVADDGTFTFTPTTPLSADQHQASATATVGRLTSAESNTNTFTIATGDTTAPAAPVLSTPADGSTTTDTTPPFTGTAEPGSQVEVFVDGNTIGTTTAGNDGAYSITPTTPLAVGDHSAYAVATDDAGNTSPHSNTNTFTIATGDTTAPAAPVITAPADGSSTDNPTPTVTGTGEPGATVTITIDTVTITIDGNEIGTAVVDQDGNFSVPVTNPLDPGAHTVSATQQDPAGNTSTADQITFTETQAPDQTPPATPVITSPGDGSTTTDPTPPITGTAEPGSTVTIVIDGQPVGTTVTGPDGTFTFTPTAPLSPGQHTISAVAVDAAGNQSQPADPVSITVVTNRSSGNGSSGNGSPNNGSPGNVGPANTGALASTGSLASTGGPAAWWWIAAVLGLTAGSAALIISRRTRGRKS